MKRENACIIIFVKAPIPGHVKTRLAKDLDESIVVGLYRNFVQDIMAKARNTGHCLKIFYDPPGSEPLMNGWLGTCHPFYLQTGSDLGRRMKNAFYRVFEDGIQQAVLMGTDFPDLTEEIIHEALSGLETRDAVIGPAKDGGYYLIGFRADTFLPETFNNMPWGTSAVYQKTMNVFANAGTVVHQLPQWRDIDEYADLADLVLALTNDPSKAPNTYLFLKRSGMIPALPRETKR